MRKAWADAARVAEVRAAARSWREAEAIDAATLQAIETAYPDPRPPLSTAWKVLIFFLVSAAVHAVFFGFVTMTSARSAAWWILFGAALTVAVEPLRGSRFAGNGSDAAVSCWAIFYLLAGIGILLLDRSPGNFDEPITWLLGVAAILFAAACVYWGYAAYGTLAVAALFFFVGRFYGGRVVWVLAAAALLRLAYARLDRASLAPPHRRAWAGAFAVSAAALYAAVNRYSLDQRWIEALQGIGPAAGPPSGALRILSAAATAVVPAAFVAWGIRARRTLVLDLGLVLTALSLVTLRAYVHLAPLWALLAGAGAVLVLGALWVNRFLRLSPGAERAGFTAAPLYGARRLETIQAAAFVAGFTGQPARPERHDLSTGGGGFGGGGASSDF